MSAILRVAMNFSTISPRVSPGRQSWPRVSNTPLAWALRPCQRVKCLHDLQSCKFPSECSSPATCLSEKRSQRYLSSDCSKRAPSGIAIELYHHLNDSLYKVPHFD